MNRGLLPALAVLCSMWAGSNRIYAQSQDAASSPAASQAATQPNEADKRLVERFLELKAAMDDSRGREFINLSRDEAVDARRWAGFGEESPVVSLSRLQGEVPATAAQLATARSAYATIVGKLEEIRKLPEFPVRPIVERSGPIELDGRLDDEAWKAAPVIATTYCFRPENAAGRPLATCRLLWDQQYLYAAFDAPDRDMIARPFVRDDATFLWDCVELFLLPDRRFGLYWELCVTPGGGITDRLVYKFPRRWFGHFTLEENIQGLRTGIEVRGTINKSDDKDQGYCVEMAIPWAEMPGMSKGPTAGQRMYGLVAWSDVNDKEDYGNQEYFGHQPTPAGFQDIWSFGVFEFVGKSQPQSKPKDQP